MELIDLHVHSDSSDGTLTPSQVVSLALSKELTAIALTDHDTVDGIDEAVGAAVGTALEVIPGTELSCMYNGKEIHILGLYIDHTSDRLTSALGFLQESRVRRNLELLGRFQEDGMMIYPEDLSRGKKDPVITRAHFAHALLEKGYASSMDQAFKKYLDHGRRYYLPKDTFTPKEAIGLILSAGGFPALAHPLMNKQGFKETEHMICDFKKMGLRGVEVYYVSHCQYESMRLREICTAHQLLPTGGSDFHGENKPDIALGSGRGGLRVPALLLDDIKKAQERV